jgi:CubicO group peptidase (beta-lactamase class C family)|tara:strand:+ start:292 stop:1461 length:1170 start_codon:yes stop_codon:yes gene_type:complete
MLSKTIRSKIIIRTLLTVVLVTATLLKTTLQDGALLEANAHLNDLMKSSDSFLLSAPAPIAGGAFVEAEKEEESYTKATVANNSLDAWFDRSQTQALIIQRKGRIIYQRYSPDAGEGRNINAMSMSKVIAAILIGVAIDDGFINSENDSISQYLPQIVQRSGDPVTLRDLLRHTSGIETAFKDIRATLKGSPLITPLSEISFNGDRSFHYDNINYHLLSLILNKIYKKPLNQLINDKLWNPLKLEGATVINTAGYCCIFATARSWLEIGSLFLNPNNQVVSANWLQKMVEDAIIPEWFFVQATGKSEGNSYGYHVYGGLPNLPDVFWIEGMGLQLVMINPKTKTVIVRLGGIPSVLNIFSNRHDDSVIAPLLDILMADSESYSDVEAID